MRRPASAWRSCRRSSACSRAFCTPRLLNPHAALRAVHAAGGPWPAARPEGVGRLAACPVIVEGPGSPGISERHGSGPPYGVGHKLQEASAILPGCACSPQGVVGKRSRSATETNALFSARSGWPTVSLHCDPSRLITIFMVGHSQPNGPRSSRTERRLGARSAGPSPSLSVAPSIDVFGYLAGVPGCTGTNGPRPRVQKQVLTGRAAAAPLSGVGTPCRSLARQAGRRQAGQRPAGSGDR